MRGANPPRHALRRLESGGLVPALRAPDPKEATSPDVIAPHSGTVGAPVTALNEVTVAIGISAQNGNPTSGC
jgi:hypothetical protein